MEAENQKTISEKEHLWTASLFSAAKDKVNLLLFYHYNLILPSDIYIIFLTSFSDLKKT